MIDEKEKIKKLIQQGYLVTICNPDEDRFSFKYKVYQNTGNLKTVIVNDRGVVVALQG